jgi:hypothetical protein
LPHYVGFSSTRRSFRGENRTYRYRDLLKAEKAPPQH